MEVDAGNAFEVAFTPGPAGLVQWDAELGVFATAIIANIDKVQSTVDWFPKTTLKEGLMRMWEAMERNNA